MTTVTPIRMPKWGLSMQEGVIVDWWKHEGDLVAEGDDLVDIETSKINNVYESPTAGPLRRIVAQPGETLPVGALIAVLAPAEVGDDEVDAFIADFQARFVPEAADDADAGGFVVSIVQAGGRNLRIGRAGPAEGDPVVLIHGYSGDLNSWLFNIEALAARRPVIAVDLPGHGGSSKDVGDGSLRELSGAVAAALAAIGVSSAHLVGHSLGAAVAARLALDQPEMAKSLTLITPAYMPGGALSEAFLTGVAETQRAKDLRPWLEKLFADPGSVTTDMIENMLKFKRTDGAEESLCLLRDRMVSGEDARSLQADFGKLPPTLIIVSRNDQIVGAPTESELPTTFRVAWIDGAGHMPHLEQAAEVNALLLQAVR